MDRPPPPEGGSERREGPEFFVATGVIFVLAGILHSVHVFLGGLLAAWLVTIVVEPRPSWLRTWGISLAAGLAGGILGSLLVPAYELRPPGASVMGNVLWLVPRMAATALVPGAVLGGGVVALFLRWRRPPEPGRLDDLRGAGVVLLAILLLVGGVGKRVMHSYTRVYGPSPGQQWARAPVFELVRAQAEHHETHGVFATELSAFELEAPMEGIELTLEGDSLSYRVTSVYGGDVARCEASRSSEEPGLPDRVWEVVRCRDLPVRSFGSLVAWPR